MTTRSRKLEMWGRHYNSRELARHKILGVVVRATTL